MTRQPAATDLDRRFSGPDAQAKPWEQAERALTEAPIYWFATVVHDLRPHVTPVIGLFADGSFYFCTGPEEQKAKNLVDNSNCAILTGANTYGDGFDIVVEGNAERVVEENRLTDLAHQFEQKYGHEWHFEVRDSAFHHHGGGEAWVFEVAPVKAFGFEKGNPPGQTRWKFGA